MSKQVLQKQSQGRIHDVLVAEDSSVTQDLLKLILSQKGYNVEIVGDGAAALAALLDRQYDVALLDFHMPKMTGLEVVTAFDADSGDQSRPVFISITSDVEGLLSNEEDCEKFDRVVPKPLNIEDICQAIEESLDKNEDDKAPGLVTEQEALRPGSPSRRRGERDAPIEQLGLRWLYWPEDFDSMRLSARALQASVSGDLFDAILVREKATISDLALIWRTKALHLLPVIDLHGALGRSADMDASGLPETELHKITALVESFHEKRAFLHDDVLYSDELGAKLLGGIFVRGQALEPSYAPSSISTIAFNIALDEKVVRTEAHRLEQNGFFDSAFFDRMHSCGNCGSSRFNVREECANCRSAHLSDEPFLHHFKCAYQGPEMDFRLGDDLVCPKCRRELSHFGHDYDKPGINVVCGDCSHTGSDPAIGFVCLDCHTHTDGEAVAVHDVFTYRLTDKALGFIEAGQSYLGIAERTLRFADLPLDIVVALNDAARRFNLEQSPFALVSIAYEREREIQREFGSRQFSMARDLFMDNLRDGLRNSGRKGKAVKGRSYDFALVEAVSPTDFEAEIVEFCAAAAATLKFEIRPSAKVFGPEDFS